jgi:hypothetical protein
MGMEGQRDVKKLTVVFSYTNKNGISRRKKQNIEREFLVGDYRLKDERMKEMFFKMSTEPTVLTWRAYRI